MARHFFKFVNNLRIRWKMMVMVLPLVLIPIMMVGAIVGYIGHQQARRGITQTSMDDLDHLANFSIDLLDAHYQQYHLYRQDKKAAAEQELRNLTNLAYSLVEAEHHQHLSGDLDLVSAKKAARRVLKRVQVGESGYIYAMKSDGTLTVHIAREGENIFKEQDDDGEYFIRKMSENARRAEPGKVMTTIYPWRNRELGDIEPRMKMVAYRYFEPWDWIIATGGYIDETYENQEFEKRAFAELKRKIKAKKVGQTGYIYCLDRKGNLTIHPDAEGENILDVVDSNGRQFVRAMVEKTSGWIRYDWKNSSDPRPRRKIVRYLHFEPWDWIVAVGSYEDEFYAEANLIKGRILSSMAIISLFTALIAAFMVFLAAKVLTDPIRHMTAVVRNVRKGNFRQRMVVNSQDELGELASTFNRMTRMLRRNRKLEADLAQQGKMASLGVLSSGVAHEINNPLGVILGYAGYLEKKMSPDDQSYHFIGEIKRESKRCKKIVQDLLNYARTPQPEFRDENINELLTQIIDFAANHTDLRRVEIIRQFDPDLPTVQVDADQIRQVAINLILNAGGAMPSGGKLTITTTTEDTSALITFTDTGCGIREEDLDEVFEPFFTTKERGTGLGLAITRQIIDQHQGTIGIISEPGRGTTISIELPFVREVI
ncbi:MAG: histidine kinase [Desulfuromonas sp.]|nr:MAG: histidine kinase [Desulfuromonas sp.]